MLLAGIDCIIFLCFTALIGSLFIDYLKESENEDHA